MLLHNSLTNLLLKKPIAAITAHFSSASTHGPSGAAAVKPLVLFGLHGCGKTSLVAKWLSKLLQAELRVHAVYHFVGCTSKSTALVQLLARLVIGLHRLAATAPPDLQDLEVAELAAAFHAALEAAAAAAAAPLYGCISV